MYPGFGDILFIERIEIAVLTYFHIPYTVTIKLYTISLAAVFLDKILKFF